MYLYTCLRVSQNKKMSNTQYNLSIKFWLFWLLSAPSTSFENKYLYISPSMSVSIGYFCCLCEFSQSLKFHVESSNSASIRNIIFNKLISESTWKSADKGRAKWRPNIRCKSQESVEFFLWWLLKIWLWFYITNSPTLFCSHRQVQCTTLYFLEL